MERHGFTTFWLWLVIITNVFSAIGSFTGNNLLLAICGYNKSLLYFYGILSIIFVIAAILILNWNKLGIWLYIGNGILGVIVVNVVNGFSLANLCGASIGCLIVIGTLKLKKDGFSTWDYIMGNVQIVNENREQKKCRQCSTLYNGYNCPKCGSSLYEETNLSSQVKGFKPISSSVTGESWTCKKCNEINSITSSSCKGCGEYK
jgi:RNA polymerase subunit RPABC4/transcription elongation factor Spt4